MISKVKTSLITSAVRNGRIALAVKLIVLHCMENNGVHTGNIMSYASSFGLTKAQVSGALSVLTQEGFYAPSDDPEYRGQYGYIDASK
jgi:hypothetical protein